MWSHDPEIKSCRLTWLSQPGALQRSFLNGTVPHLVSLPYRAKQTFSWSNYIAMKTSLLFEVYLHNKFYGVVLMYHWGTVLVIFRGLWFSNWGKKTDNMNSSCICSYFEGWFLDVTTVGHNIVPQYTSNRYWDINTQRYLQLNSSQTSSYKFYSSNAPSCLCPLQSFIPITSTKVLKHFSENDKSHRRWKFLLLFTLKLSI